MKTDWLATYVHRDNTLATEYLALYERTGTTRKTLTGLAIATDKNMK